MTANVWRVALLAVAWGAVAPGTASAKIALITTGDTITHLGDVGKVPGGAKGLPFGGTIGVGYKWSYAGLFWIDFWTWGGEYCLHVGDRYEPITPEKAAEYLGQTAPPGRPFLYKFPLGLLILGGFLLFGVLGTIFKSRKEHQEEQGDDDLDQYRVNRKE